MIQRLVISFLLFFFLFFCYPSLAQDLPSLIKRVENRLKEISSFELTFYQELYNPNIEEKEVKKGRFFFQKEPLKMRWEICEPKPEILLITKDLVLDYYPQEKVAYKYDFKNFLNSKLIIKFLSGNISFDEFEVKKVYKSQKDKLIKIELIPKNPEPSLILAYLYVDENDIIRGMEFVDFFNNKNKIFFKKITLNKKIDPKIFKLPDKNIKILKRTNF